MFIQVLGYPCHSIESLAAFMDDKASVYPDTSKPIVIIWGLDMLLLAHLQKIKDKQWMVCDTLSQLIQLRIPLTGVILTSPSKYVRIPLTEPVFIKTEIKKGIAFEVLAMHARRMLKKIEAASKTKKTTTKRKAA